MVAQEKFLFELNGYLEADSFSDYCPNGLQVEGEREIKKAAFTVSVSLDSITQAIEAGADALVVHHGLFWNKDPYPVVASKKERLSLLLKHGISLFAYHLPLDAHQEVGNNWAAAKQMGWEALAPFDEIGVMGRLTPTPVDAFVKQLEQFYNHPAKSALGGGDTIRSAALISGGAYKQMQAAIDAGVDCFITGNFDEPAWHLAHEEGIHFFALGHAATERIGIRLLGEWVNKTLGIDVVQLVDNNPF